MLALKAVLFAFLFLLIIYLLGSIPIFSKSGSILVPLINGVLFAFAIFEFLSIPMILLRFPFTYLIFFFAGIILILIILSIVLNKSKLFTPFEIFFNSLRNINIFYIFAICLILFQLYKTVVYMHIDDDDAFYIGTATTTLQTNTMFQYKAETGAFLSELPTRHALSPLPVFIAALSYFSKIHPAILAHTILPVIWLLFSYFVYFLIGKVIFHEDHKKTGLLLIYISLINMFGYYSIYSASTFSLIRGWQGKAMLASWIIPWLLYVHLVRDNHRYCIRSLLSLTIFSCGTVMVSSMGIIIAPIIIGVFGILDIRTLKKKSDILKLSIPCLPCMVLALISILLQKGILH